MTQRTQLKIGNWTVRTMYSAGRSAQAARAMNQMNQISTKKRNYWANFYIKKYHECQSSLYGNVIDFEKAFGSVHRIVYSWLWEAKRAYHGFECAVVNGRDSTEWFKIKTGVKQGCNMSVLLFLLFVKWVMKNSLQEGSTGIRWKFTTKLVDLDFADEIVL